MDQNNNNVKSTTPMQNNPSLGNQIQVDQLQSDHQPHTGQIQSVQTQTGNNQQQVNAATNASANVNFNPGPNSPSMGISNQESERNKPPVTVNTSINEPVTATNQPIENSDIQNNPVQPVPTQQNQTQNLGNKAEPIQPTPTLTAKAGIQNSPFADLDHASKGESNTIEKDESINENQTIETIPPQSSEAQLNYQNMQGNQTVQPAQPNQTIQPMQASQPAQSNQNTQTVQYSQPVQSVNTDTSRVSQSTPPVQPPTQPDQQNQPAQPIKMNQPMQANQQVTVDKSQPQINPQLQQNSQVPMPNQGADDRLQSNPQTQNLGSIPELDNEFPAVSTESNTNTIPTNQPTPATSVDHEKMLQAALAEAETVNKPKKKTGGFFGKLFKNSKKSSQNNNQPPGINVQTTKPIQDIPTDYSNNGTVENTTQSAGLPDINAAPVPQPNIKKESSKSQFLNPIIVILSVILILLVAAVVVFAIFPETVEILGEFVDNSISQFM